MPAKKQRPEGKQPLGLGFVREKTGTLGLPARRQGPMPEAPKSAGLAPEASKSVGVASQRSPSRRTWLCKSGRTTLPAVKATRSGKNRLAFDAASSRKLKRRGQRTRLGNEERGLWRRGARVSLEKPHASRATPRSLPPPFHGIAGLPRTTSPRGRRRGIEAKKEGENNARACS